MTEKAALTKIQNNALKFYKKVKELKNIELLGEYTGCKNKIKYKCLRCGSINENVPLYILKEACKNCSGKRISQKLSTPLNVFLEKLKEINPNIEYISNYSNSSSRVKVRCKVCKHEWETKASHLLEGHSCPKCAIIRNGIKKSEKYAKIFTERANKVHNNKYDYSKVNYVTAKTLVSIICPKHGEFQLTPDAHLRGARCPKCAGKLVSNTKEFIEKAKEMHGNKYDYSKVDYKRTSEKVCIICPIHGEFWQTPNHHLNGYGCKKCKRSKGEDIIALFLERNKINFISLYKIPISSEINSSGFAYIDFYLPDYNLFIEYNGIQHYKPIERFGGQISLDRQIQRDLEVEKYCKISNINLLIIKENTGSIHKQKILEKLNNVLNINNDAIKMI